MHMIRRYYKIRNFPIINDIDNSKPLDIKKEKTVVIYTGKLSRIRGIKETIEAMQYIGNKAELWLLGEWENDEFKQRCEKLKGWTHTKYFGFKKPNKVYGYLKNADVGLHIVYPIERYMLGLPTKVFEYMTCSLPAVMTESPYWIKLFEKNAIFANPQNPKDIADKISILLKDKDLGSKMGKAGRILIEKQYSWESESKKLLTFYSLLAHKEEL